MAKRKNKYLKKKTAYPCVWFYEHPKRKHHNKPDRRFLLRYRWNGKQIEEGVGWGSEGWNAIRASEIIAELKQNQRIGSGPKTMKEKRDLDQTERDAEKIRKEDEAKALITFKEYFTDFYYPISKTNKFFGTYRKELEHFKHYLDPVLGHLPLKEIVPLNLEAVKKRLMKKKRAPRTIQYVFATFRQIWNTAMRDDLVDTESPTKQVKVPKLNNERTRYFTIEESEVLLNDLIKRSRKLHDIAMLSLHTGMRHGEICSVKWQDIDLENGRINVTGKGNKTRVVYMTSQIKKMFSGYEKGNRGDFVFTDRKGEKIEQVSNAFNRSIKELGFNKGIKDRRKKLSFHSLRHSHASILVQSGENLYTVQKILGHSTIKLTERYSHLADENRLHAVRLFESALNKKPKPEVIDINKNGY